MTPISSLDTRYRRARADPDGVLLAGAVEAGVRFRWAGADLVVDRLERLPAPSQVLLAQRLGAITERLTPHSPDAGANGTPLEQLGIEAIEVITDGARAREVCRALPAEVGLDIETEARPGYAVAWPWLAITKKGLLAKYQPKPRDDTALNPRKARPRLVQVYDGAGTVYVFDLHHVSLEDLAELWSRRLWIHNSAFEITMLGAQGVSLPSTVDTMQMAGLLLGCAIGSRRLENVSEQILSVSISKTEQLSDWSAPRLSPAQVEYAAIDAAAAYRAGRVMNGMLDEQRRRCFRLQNAAVPVAAKMKLAGLPFARDVHLKTIERWELELADKRARFLELTGEAPPARHKVGAWIEANLPAEEIEWMPRTPKTGAVSAKSDLLKYLAHHAEIRPLLDVLKARKRLESFGHKLIELIDPATGRIYPDYMTCGAKTGRLTSSHPNGQQFPDDMRGAIRARDGYLLVSGDLVQIELRVFAELADEQVMREVFATGGDIHRRTAAWVTGVPEKEIGDDDPRRKGAKAVNFGIVFAAGPRTIRASARSKFDLDMSIEEATTAKAAVMRAYPAIGPYQQRQADLGLNARVIHSKAGRPLRADWAKNSELKFTTCSNFPVQSSAADILLRSMALLDRKLVGLDAQLILSVHDELVVEVAEDVAEEVKQLLVDTMTRAFSEFFPGAPALGLFKVKIAVEWS
jgi:DNA polymerase I